MLKRWPKTSILAIIAVISTFILIAATQGIIGNSADALFLWVFDEITKSIITDLWLWIIIFILLTTHIPQFACAFFAKSLAVRPCKIELITISTI